MNLKKFCNGNISLQEEKIEDGGKTRFLYTFQDKDGNILEWLDCWNSTGETGEELRYNGQFIAYRSDNNSCSYFRNSGVPDEWPAELKDIIIKLCYIISKQ